MPKAFHTIYLVNPVNPVKKILCSLSSPSSAEPCQSKIMQNKPILKTTKMTISHFHNKTNAYCQVPDAYKNKPISNPIGERVYPAHTLKSKETSPITSVPEGTKPIQTQIAMKIYNLQFPTYILKTSVLSVLSVAKKRRTLASFWKRLASLGRSLASFGTRLATQNHQKTAFSPQKQLFI